jgi:HlyD family secretion protein
LLAETNLRRAQASYDQLAWNPLIATMSETSRLQEATSALEAAQAHYDVLIQGASDHAITEAYAKLASARANLQRLEDGPDATSVEAVEAAVRQAETALYLAQLQLEKAVVVAPVDAIVAEINVTVGETAQEGSPAFSLISPEVQIEILVEERRTANLQVGQAARVRVEGYPDQEFEATISKIAPQLDSTTHTLRVTVRPTDTSAPLLPGMRATVELLPPFVE